MGNDTEAAMAGQSGAGTVEELMAVVADELVRPPGEYGRAMALVVGDGGADHLGLLVGGAAAPGGLGLLASAVTARARPGAALLLEWVGLAGQRHYLGWAVERRAALVAWRRLGAEELRAVIDPRTRRALGEEAGATFDP
jgi:hypothetical protein